MGEITNLRSVQEDAPARLASPRRPRGSTSAVPNRRLDPNPTPPTIEHGSDDAQDPTERNVTDLPEPRPAPSGELAPPSPPVAPPTISVAPPPENRDSQDPGSTEAVREGPPITPVLTPDPVPVQPVQVQPPEESAPPEPKGDGCPPGMSRAGAACVRDEVQQRIGITATQVQSRKKKRKEASRLMSQIRGPDVGAEPFARRIAQAVPQLNKQRFRKQLLDVGADMASIVNAQRQLQAAQLVAQQRPDLQDALQMLVEGARNKGRLAVNRLKNKGVL